MFSYVYLGRAISCTNTLDAEISRRIRAGWATFHNISEVLATLSDQKMKAQIFDSCVLPGHWYATETWALKERTRSRIRTPHRDMERRVMEDLYLGSGSSIFPARSVAEDHCCRIPSRIFIG